jgi:hypothetical protein
MLMKISYEQMRILDLNAARYFEDRAAQHIARIFPERYKQLGQIKTRQLIREGIAKAGTYGIKAELPVTLFIDLMVSIDPEFDNLERMQWARAILEDKKFSGKSRMNIIYYKLPYKEKEAELQSAAKEQGAK